MTAEPERWPYGYCEHPECHSRRGVIVNKARWKWAGMTLCTACLKREQRLRAAASHSTADVTTSTPTANPRRVRRA